MLMHCVVLTVTKLRKGENNQGYRLIIEKKMKKLLTVLALCLMVCIVCMSAVSCNNNQPDNGGEQGGNTNQDGGENNTPTPDDGGNKVPEEIIASLTATEASTSLKIGESLLITNFYEIKGNSTLSAAQRSCTYESSNPDVVKINAKRAEAVSSGTAIITVTSNVDSSKSCSFEIVVSKVFIDRDLTMIPSEDDFSNEWNDATGTGSFRTNSGITNFYYIADVCSSKWYVETDITVNAVNWDDRWPKIGIVAEARNAEGVETMVAFFLNASIGLNDDGENRGQDNLYWNEFGVCEVAQGGHWAWEAGITNSLARHHDYCWNTGDTKITFGDTFKLGVARDGANFHVYVNGNYMGSFQLSSELEILYENGQPMDSHVAFYNFSSDVTYANYLATTDEAAVNAKIPAEPIYCEFLED